MSLGFFFVGHTAGELYEQPAGETYRYDQLGRISTSRFYPYDALSQQWDTTTSYATSYTYDPNGNIDSLRRNASTSMASLIFNYNDADADPTNRLDRVQDAVTGGAYQEDIDSGQNAGNYVYDARGSLITDASEGGMTMTWTPEGRVKQVSFTRAAAGLYDGSQVERERLLPLLAQSRFIQGKLNTEFQSVAGRNEQGQSYLRFVSRGQRTTHPNEGFPERRAELARKPRLEIQSVNRRVASAWR